MSIPQFVQKNETWPGTPATTTALVLPSNVLPNSRLVAAVAWNSIVQTASVADNINGAWQAIGSPQDGAGALGSWRLQLFLSPPTKVGSTTVTATFTASLSGRALAVCEYSGVNMDANVVDDFDYVSVNSDGLVLPAITTTHDNDVLFAAAVVEDSISGAGSGWTIRADAASWAGNGTEDQIVFVTGTYTPDFPEPFAMENLGAIIALKGADEPNTVGTSLVAGRLPNRMYRPTRSSIGAPQAVDAPQPIVPPLLSHLVAVQSRVTAQRGRRPSRYRIGAPKVINAAALAALNQERVVVQAVKRRRNWRPGRGTVGRPQVVLITAAAPIVDATTTLAASGRSLRVTRTPSSMLGFPGAVVGPQGIVNIELRPVSAPQPDVRRTRRTHSSLGAPQAVGPIAVAPVDVTVNVTLAGRTRANLARRRVRSGVGGPQAVNPRAAVLSPIQTTLVVLPAVKRRPTHASLGSPTATLAIQECSEPVGPVTTAVEMTAPNVLGCSTYQVAVVTRGGHELVMILPWSSLSWERVLDDTSSASVSGAIGSDADCEECQAMAAIRAWRHELAIYRNGELVWIGPIINKRLPPGEFTLNARDLSAWLDHRKIHANHIYAQEELATIFEDLFDDAMEPDPSPNLSLSISPSGVKATKRFLRSQNLITGSQLRDITSTGIDWTTIGREIVAGGLAVPTDPVGTFVDAHFTTPPTPLFSGEQQGNAITVRGAGGGASGDRIAYTSSDFQAINDDGLLESVESVSTIKDFPSAIQASETRLALRKEVIQIENCVLAPTAPFPVSSLIPGARCPVNLQETCEPVVGTFRLKSVSTSASSSGDDSFTLVLQPEGTTSPEEG